MKKILLSFLLLFSSVFSLHAQNYQCFKHDSTIYWYTNDIYYLRGIRIDSVIASGVDTIYYPYHTARNISTLDTLKASWVGYGVTQQPDGAFLFKNAYNDTVVIKTQAHVGDNWVFYHDTSTLFYRATVASADTMTILGTLDSVKNIVINAYNPSLVSTDYVNNFTIVLSKNHGFAQIFDLYNFPYHDPTSHTVNCNDSYFMLNMFGTPPAHEQIFNVVAFHIPSQIEMWNFHATDVVGYSFTTYCNCWNTDIEGTEYDSVLYRNDIDSFHTKIALYKYDYTYSVMCTEPDSDRHFYPYTQIDTIILDSSAIFAMPLLPEEYGQYTSYYYNPIDTTHCITSPLLSYKPFNYFEGCGLNADYKVGVATLDSDYCQIDCVGGLGISPGATTVTTLIYLRKGASVCGTNPGPLRENIVSSSNSDIIISPNPTNDLLTITITNANSLYTFMIINAFGQVLKSTSSNSGKVTLDVKDLSSGLYYVNIVSETGNTMTKKIVVMH